MEIFRLYDTKAEGWLPIFTEHNSATAIRALTQKIAEGQAPNFEDMALFHVGTDDPDDTGQVYGHLPKHVVYLADLSAEVHRDKLLGRDADVNHMMAAMTVEEN